MALLCHRKRSLKRRPLAVGKLAGRLPATPCSGSLARATRFGAIACVVLFGAPGLLARGPIGATATKFEPGSPCLEQRGEGKRALVTGITGMLGSHIAEALIRQGYQVYGVIRSRSNVRNVASFHADVKLVTVELTDPWRTQAVIKDIAPHFIFHFAAQAFNSISYAEPQYTMHTNVVSTLNILEAVRGLEKESGSNVRILFASSSTVYGSSAEEWNGPVPEDAPLKPVSPYGVSKASSELLALQYARTYGLQVIVARFFIHLAPRGVEALALHEFARQIAMIERGLQAPAIQHGDLSTVRDITDIVDSAPVVVCLAEAAASETVVNIGSNTSYTMRSLLEQAVAESTVNGITLELDRSRLRAYDERIVMADNSRVRSLTGWQPQPDMPNLIRLLLEYWRHEVAYRHPEGTPRASGGRPSAEL